MTVFPADVRKESPASRLAEAEPLMASSLVWRRLTSQHLRIDESFARQLTTTDLRVKIQFMLTAVS